MTDRAAHLRRIERERREVLVLLERGAEGFEFRSLTEEEKKEFENSLAAKSKPPSSELKAIKQKLAKVYLPSPTAAH